jgi:glucan phosphoethanolaminetransferase (alkaline phosphatase superfamily)
VEFSPFEISIIIVVLLLPVTILLSAKMTPLQEFLYRLGLWILPGILSILLALGTAMIDMAGKSQLFRTASSTALFMPLFYLICAFYSLTQKSKKSLFLRIASVVLLASQVLILGITW